MPPLRLILSLILSLSIVACAGVEGVRVSFVGEKPPALDCVVGVVQGVIVDEFPDQPDLLDWDLDVVPESYVFPEGVALDPPEETGATTVRKTLIWFGATRYVAVVKRLVDETGRASHPAQWAIAHQVISHILPMRLEASVNAQHGSRWLELERKAWARVVDTCP